VFQRLPDKAEVPVFRLKGLLARGTEQLSVRVLLQEGMKLR